MAKFRMQFTKHGDMKYVSHLDMIRLFTRIFHRADLPLAYSEGFNPHPKMSVLLPLSVGLESDCEYIDVSFQEGVSMLDCLKKLKGATPIGLDIVKISEVLENSAKPKEIRYAEYKIKTDCDLSHDCLDKFLSRETIEVLKKTKRSEAVADIKPDIMDLRLGSENEIFAVLSAGSQANLKPSVLLSAMEEYIDGFKPCDISVCRTGILTERGEPLIK